MKNQNNKPKTVTGTDENGMFCITRPKLKAGDLLILFLLFLALFSNGQTTVKLENGVYKSQTTTRAKKEAVNTGKIYEDSKGTRYPIFKTDSAYFVLRTSAKSGNQYKQYIKLQ